MTEKILKQKRLMQKAVDCLDFIQNIERVYISRDFLEGRKMIEARQQEYADIMRDLIAAVLTDTGFKIKEMEVA